MQGRGRPGYEQNYRRGNVEGIQGHIKISEDRMAKENIEVIKGVKIAAEREVGVDLEKGHFQEIIVVIIEGTSNSRSRSGSRASINRDRIRCYKCREYDHFAKDCPTSNEEREIEQIQQMFNLDEEKTSLKALATAMYDSLNK